MTTKAMDGEKPVLSGDKSLLSQKEKAYQAPLITNQLLAKLDEIVSKASGNLNRDQVLQLGIELLYEAIGKDIYLGKNRTIENVYDLWK